MRPTWESRVLSYDPFAGDRDCNVRVLDDRLITTRTSHTCTICWDEIACRSRVRARREISYDDRRAMTFYFCPACCDGMAKSWRDAGRAIEARTAIGMRRAGALPA